jgi:hypothetical protein
MSHPEGPPGRPNQTERGKPKFPGDNNVLPNNEPTDETEMAGDVERDVSNEGVQMDPRSRGRDIAP